MKVAFFVNYLNHHQAPLADELFKLLGDDFCFIEIRRPDSANAKGSMEDFSHRPYLVKAWECEQNKQKAEFVAKNALCAVFGAESLPYEILRMRTTKGLALEMSERWLKRGLINILSPRLLKYQWHYHTLFYNKPLYKLCASAFAASDHYKLFSFRGRCYKWGYFTKWSEVPVLGTSTSENTSFMWCARFLRWKHPELPVLLAARLKKQGYNFLLDMYGAGDQLETIKQLVKSLHVEDVVKFKGNVPNDQVLQAMREHEIFLFTSDRYEGWGAVLNEAMGCGCAVVGSDEIGSVPFLIHHRKTGCQFKSCSIESLEEEVVWLLEHQVEMNIIRMNAQKYIRDTWSPQNVAKSFLTLIDCLKIGNASPIKDGPCEKIP